jgi:alcohol dehydrogenase (cytochrome c)
MSKVVFILAFGAFGAVAQVKNYTPVTKEMLLNPPASDWLMFSRTYDGQRFSPLNQTNSRNVAQLRTAWSRGIGAGTLESIPLVHNGVMYVLGPSATILALDATDGELLWQYKREVPANVASQSRAKTLSIYDDVIVYTSPDSFLVGLDARTGGAAVGDEGGHPRSYVGVDCGGWYGDFSGHL